MQKCYFYVICVFFRQNKDDFAERTGILKSFNVNAGQGSLKWRAPIKLAVFRWLRGLLLTCVSCLKIVGEKIL